MQKGKRKKREWNGIGENTRRKHKDICLKREQSLMPRNRKCRQRNGGGDKKGNEREEGERGEAKRKQYETKDKGESRVRLTKKKRKKIKKSKSGRKEEKKKGRKWGSVIRNAKKTTRRHRMDEKTSIGR